MHPMYAAKWPAATPPLRKKPTHVTRMATGASSQVAKEARAAAAAGPKAETELKRRRVEVRVR